jgi:GNAT superfamily N-acetyltransferase
MSSEQAITFYRHPQSSAAALFPSLLEAHLPQSNPIRNRLVSPLNTPERHCLFAASFPPESSPLQFAQSSSSASRAGSEDQTSELKSDVKNREDEQPWTIIFTDRSRSAESQIWLFSSLITRPTALNSEQITLLRSHSKSAISFILTTEIPEAPGWPFSPILRFAAVHEVVAREVQGMYGDKVEYVSWWKTWILSIDKIEDSDSGNDGVQGGFEVARVPEQDIGKVIETSSIPRQAETLARQANICLISPEKEMVAWAYLGVCGSLATLYVIPEYRGRGLAKTVARVLLKRVREGGYRDLGVEAREWVHAEVGEGNAGSEGVMRSLGAEVGWWSAYARLNGEMVKG